MQVDRTKHCTLGLPDYNISKRIKSVSVSEHGISREGQENFAK